MLVFFLFFGPPLEGWVAKILALYIAAKSQIWPAFFRNIFLLIPYFADESVFTKVKSLHYHISTTLLKQSNNCKTLEIDPCRLVTETFSLPIIHLMDKAGWLLTIG